MGQNGKIRLIFVVSGVEVPHETQTHAPLHAAIGAVLAAGKVEGRNDPNEWVLKTADGTTLDVSKKVEDLGLQDGAKIFLSPKVSGGGE